MITYIHSTFGLVFTFHNIHNYVLRTYVTRNIFWNILIPIYNSPLLTFMEYQDAITQSDLNDRCLKQAMLFYGTRDSWSITKQQKSGEVIYHN